MLYDDWPEHLHYRIANYPGSGYVCIFEVKWLPGMALDFRDVRFSDGLGQKLSYFIMKYTSGTSATIGVRLRTSPNVSLHYGKGSVSSESNGNTTFDFFDHFLGTSLDTNKWSSYGAGTKVVSNSECVITGGDGYIRAKTAFETGYIFGARMKTNRWNTTAGVQQIGFSFLNGTEAYYDKAILFAFCNAAGFDIGLFHQNAIGAYSMSFASPSDWTANTYGIAEVVRRPTTTELRINFVSKVVNSTSYYPTDSLYPYLRCNNSSDMEVIDYAYVRKYAATEPSPVFVSGNSTTSQFVKYTQEFITPNLFEIGIPKLQTLSSRVLIKPGSDTLVHENSPTSKTDKYRDWPDVIRYRIDNFPGATYICIFDIKWLPGMRADFADIRFSDGRGATLSYFINSYTSASVVQVLVKLGTSSTVYLHYGNASARSESTSAILTYYDNFSTDTSSNYAIQYASTNSKAVKAYDSVNKCLKQTNTGSSQHWIVCMADNNTNDIFTFEAKYRVSNDAAARNHGGAILEWSTTAMSGYRISHLDNTFMDSHYIDGSEVTWGSNTVADTNIYADDRWVTYRVHRNRLTGDSYTTYIYGSNSTTLTFYPPYNDFFTSGHVGIHSYGCETWIKDIKIWKSAAVEPVPVMVGSNRTLDVVKLAGVVFSVPSTHYDRETGIFLSISQTVANGEASFHREASSKVTKSDTDAERTLKSKRDSGSKVTKSDTGTERILKSERDSGLKVIKSDTSAVRTLESKRTSGHKVTKVDTHAIAGTALNAETGVYVSKVQTGAGRELASERTAGNFIHPQVKGEASAAHTRETGVFSKKVDSSTAGESVFERDSGFKVTKSDISANRTLKSKRATGIFSKKVDTYTKAGLNFEVETGVYLSKVQSVAAGEAVFHREAASKVTKIDTALSGSPKLQRTSGVYANKIQSLLEVVEPYHRGTVTFSRSVRYKDFLHYREYSIQNFPGKDCLCAITIPWLPGMQGDFRDIRFTDKFDNKLSYYLESYTAFQTATVQVKLGETSIVNLYYGNGTATSESTTSVYAYFDDFSTDTTSRYATYNENSSYPTVISYDSAGKQLKQTATDAHAHMIYCTVDTLPSTYMYEVKVYVATDTQNRNHAGVLFDYSSTTAYHFYRLATLDSTVACSRWDSSSTETTMATGVSNTNVYADARWLTYRIFRNRTTGATTCKIIYGSNTTTQTFTNATYNTGHIGLFSWGNVTWYKDIKVWKATSLTEPTAVLRSSGATQRFAEIEIIPGSQYLVMGGVKVSPVQTQGTYNITYRHDTGVYIDPVNTDTSRLLHLPREVKVYTIIQTLAGYSTGGFSRTTGSFLDPHVKAEGARKYTRSSAIYLEKSYSVGGTELLFFRLGNAVYLNKVSTVTTKTSVNHSFFGAKIPAPSVYAARERNKYLRNSGVFSLVSEKVSTEGEFNRTADSEIPGIKSLTSGIYGQNRDSGIYVPAIQSSVNRLLHLKTTSGLDIPKPLIKALITGIYFRESYAQVLSLTSAVSTEGSFNRSSGNYLTIQTLAEKEGIHDRLAELFFTQLQVSSGQISSLLREANLIIPAPSVLLSGAVNFDHPHSPFVITIAPDTFTATISSSEYGVTISKNLQYAVLRDGETMLEITQYDTDTFTVTLQDTDPTTGELRPMPLSGRTVKAVLKGGTPTSEVVVDCDIVSDGAVQFSLSSEDTAIPGTYIPKFVILGTNFRKELPETRDDFQTLVINDAAYTTI